MDISERKQKLAEIRRDLSTLGSKLAVQQVAVTKKLGFLENLRVGLNLHHAYEASVARQQHAQHLGFAAEVEAEKIEQLMLVAVAEALRES